MHGRTWLSPLLLLAIVAGLSQAALDLWPLEQATSQAGSGSPVQDQVAAGGTNLYASGGPDIFVDPTTLSAEQCADTVTTQDLQICNNGTGDLTWNIAEVSETLAFGSRPVVLSLAPALEADPDSFPLVLDDGSYENNVGIGGTWDFIWLNRFTPSPNDFPFTIWEVQVYFSSDGSVNVGDEIVVVLYENKTGGYDPAPGSHWLASFPATVRALDGWNYYDLSTPVVFNGPGDALIGVIALETPGTDYSPAAIDQTTTQKRSWIGWWLSSPPSPPWLPPDDSWVLIDDYFPGNWMIRGYGEGIVPLDIPWVSEAPITGVVPISECTTVEVTLGSAGMLPGSYTSGLAVNSNDPGEPVVLVPITMTVDEPASIIDVSTAITGMTVTFTPGVVGHEPVSHAWDFGDSTTSTETNPVHSYAEGGCYSVTLDIVNICGMDSWAGQACVEEGCDPVHDAGWNWYPPTPLVDEVVYLTGTATGAGPITYEWDLGDGTTGIGASITHTYTLADDYTVVMTATNGCGVATATHVVTVAAPVTQWSAYLPLVFKGYAP